MNVTERNTPRPRDDPTMKTAHFRHDWDDDEPLSAALVSTVAELEGTDATELELLYDHADPDALDELFAPTTDESCRTDGHVWFPLAGYGITVYGDGFTVVRKLE